MKKILFVLVALSGFHVVASPRVFSTIYPLQQIANAITGEQTGLIVDTYLSPHSYHPKPSDAKDLLAADILLTVGEVLMPQLNSYIKQRKGKITLRASQLPGIDLIKGHHHHDQDELGEAQQLYTQHTHQAFYYDPHLWLSPDNALVIATALTQQLKQVDPQNQTQYEKHLIQFKQQLQQTVSSIKQQLENIEPVPYFVFHDAYRYFENYFDIASAGIIRAHVGQSVRTKHLTELKAQLDKLPIACLFREPQFKSSIVDKLAQNPNLVIATIDPIGYTKPAKGYSKILTDIADALVLCSQGASR